MDFTADIIAALSPHLPDADILNYCERVQADYDELAPFLPAHVLSFVDVGSGWGGHALYLAKHYGPDIKVFLIEGNEEVPKTQSGYHETATPYRDGTIGLRLLRSHSVAARLYTVNTRTQNLTIPVDLITSFCSYGHHYPISTYLPLVLRSLQQGGHLLVDIRTGTSGEDELRQANFDLLRVIKEKPKFTRILFQKR